MSRLEELKAATSLHDVAHLLGLKPAHLAYVLYKLQDTAKYKTFEVKKKNGGSRTIKAPVDQLKLVQRRLSDLLSECWSEICLKHGRKDQLSHGFKRNRSLITNARPHRNRRFVLNLDLKDFFPSINFGRVRGYFLKDRDFELHEKVATVLAQIACHANELPQGSPSSPVISNLIAHVLDVSLVAVARASNCHYTRYADDITFSTNEPIFPERIATPSATAPHQWFLGKRLLKVISRHGFLVNDSKTRMQYCDSRQVVTGLVVNKKVNVRQDYRRETRAMAHNSFRKGHFEIHTSGGIEKGTLQQLEGRFVFIDSIDLFNAHLVAASAKATTPKRGEFALRPLSQLSCTQRMYRRFLHFKEFFAASRPTILSEGETDNVYLVHAIRSLHGSFPQLVEKQKDGSLKFKVHLFKYPQTRRAAILGLGNGGTSQIAGLIKRYVADSEIFTADVCVHPLLVIYDNDAGKDDIENAIKALKGSIPASGEFSFIAPNLYLIPVPLKKNSSQTAIEDLFPDEVRKTKVDGKSFKPNAKGQQGDGYGKIIFAHKVVRPLADTIDFSGFSLLFNVIVSAIADFATKKKPASPPKSDQKKMKEKETKGKVKKEEKEMHKKKKKTGRPKKASKKS